MLLSFANLSHDNTTIDRQSLNFQVLSTFTRCPTEVAAAFLTPGLWSLRQDRSADKSLPLSKTNNRSIIHQPALETVCTTPA